MSIAGVPPTLLLATVVEPTPNVIGVGVTMPAILILGFDLEITRVMLVAILGGLLGILMMIPLRRALIVAQHGILKYPEGTACAEVLKAGASAESRAAASPEAKREQEKLGAGTSAKTIFTGFGFALAYKTAMVAFQAWKEAPEKIFGAPFRNASISAEVSPELMGVGYIIGQRIDSIITSSSSLRETSGNTSAGGGPQITTPHR